MKRNTHTRLLAIALGALVAFPAQADAQWSQVYEQAYLQAPHNWVFRTEHPAADRLFNAFDYGHAILYEKLYTSRGKAVEELEVKQYNYLTTKLLVNPPRVPLEELAIEPTYGRLAPEARAMFEWAHILHRQAYDILADDRLNATEQRREIDRLVRYYKTRPSLAFSSKPKTMALMQEQPYSLAFRNNYPKFNGLIWAYHWLQVGLYEPLVTGATADARRAGVLGAVARFKSMVVDAPEHLPYVMPMTAAVAPEFAKQYQELAIIFDNLHSMHDVISDILANPSVPRNRKRAEILIAAEQYRDDTTEVMSVDGWLRMSAMMGVENMGGVATDVFTPRPTPSVERGYVMRHDREGNMIGEHAGHEMAATPTPAADAHAGHQMPGMAAPANDSAQVNDVLKRFFAALDSGDVAAISPMLAAGATVAITGVTVPAADRASALARAFTGQGRGEVRSIQVNGQVAWATWRGEALATTVSVVLSKTTTGWLIVQLQR